MESTQIAIPDSSELSIGAAGAVKMAEALQINSDDDMIAAAELRDHCDSKIKLADMLFDDARVASDKLHKYIVKLWKTAAQPWEQAGRIIKAKMIQWDRDQITARRLEQARLEAEEKARREKEKAETVQLLRELGLNEQAEYAKQQEVAVQPVVLPQNRPVELKYRSNWTFEVVDEDVIPKEYLMPNMVKIGAVVRALKGQTNIPGIKVVEHKV